MTEVDAHEALSARFAAQWPDAAPGVPFAIENEPGELPAIPPNEADSFALFQLVPTTSSQMTMGGPGEREIRRNGWIQIKLWTPAGARTDGMGQLAQAVRSLFEFKSIAGVDASTETIDVLDCTPQSTQNDGRWYSRVIVAPYQFFELG